MRGLFEFTGFVGIALAAHVALFSQGEETLALEGAGAGGEELLSVQPSTAQIEALVEDWTRPPEAQAESARLEAPEASAAAEALPDRVPAPSPTAATALALPLMAPLEGAAVLPTVQPPPVAKPKPKPKPKAKAKPAPKAKPKPATKAKPEPKAKAKPAKAQKAQAARKAQGAGGGAAKGKNKLAKAATLSKSKRNSMLAHWGGQIRSRIARRAPQGAGRGTAVVLVTVSARGQLLGVRLAKSSGNARIDKLALSAVKKAGRFPKAPRQLGVSSHSFRLPIKSR